MAAPRRETVQVKGLTEFLRATNKAERETKKVVREKLRDAGDVVREEASKRFAPFSAKSAAGYRTRVRVRGVEVEQSLRKTTGARPDFGALQMSRALIPALVSKEDEVERNMEKAAEELSGIVAGTRL